MRRTSSRTIPKSRKSLFKFSTLNSWEICSICSRVIIHVISYIYIYINGQSQNQWTLVRLTFLDLHITIQLLLVVHMSLVLILIRQSQLLRSSTQLGKGLKQLKTESGRVGLKLLLGSTQRPLKSTTSHSDKRKSTTKRVLHQRLRLVLLCLLSQTVQLQDPQKLQPQSHLHHRHHCQVQRQVPLQLPFGNLI